MNTCRLVLLGPPHVERDQQIIQVKLRKAVALAAYLSLERKPFTREYLAALLWPDLPQASALANLRRTLFHLRRTFGDDCFSGDADQIQMDLTRLTVDVDEFDALCRLDSGNGDLQQLVPAIELYRGSFMEGFNLGDCLDFDEWQDSIRERLLSQFDELLETLAGSYLRAGQPREALPFARRWLELDHTNEPAHRALMEIYAVTGRTDLARKQFKACARLLEREGLEPDDSTHELNAAIMEHRLPASEGPDSAVPSSVKRLRHTRRRGRRGRRIVAAVAACVLVVAAVAVYGARFRIFGANLEAAGIEVYRSGEELAGARAQLRNSRLGLPDAEFALVFTSDGSIGTHHDYVVYSNRVRMGPRSTKTVEISRAGEIDTYIETHRVMIPPGYYVLSFVVDPEERIAERAELDNRVSSNDPFFYPGKADAFEVEIACDDGNPLDATKPLRVFIGDRKRDADLQTCGRFTVTREGTYYFPLEDIGFRDSDGSGYFMLIVHDAENNPAGQSYVDPGDLAGLYKDVPGGLVYGAFSLAGGTPFYPGSRCTARLSPPPFPGPDAYELDDFCELATAVDFRALPVRQYHTFHDEGTGDTDEDWFRIYLETNETLTVETFSADGMWESNTRVDIADSQMDYITSNDDKTFDDLYSRLAYTNDTGTSQWFHILVKPFFQFNYSTYPVGEYVVEFRR